MSLDGWDEARLRRIEVELAAADPALARRFRRWNPSGTPEVVAPGWLVVPSWVLVVFLIGFTTWMVAPAFGAAIAVVAGCRAAWGRAQRGPTRRSDNLREGRW